MRTLLILAMLAWAQDESAKAPTFSWNSNKEVGSGYRNAPWVRDPFFRSSSLKLTGIISGKLAYVDGKWVAVGDRVGKYVVRDISGNSVRLVDSLSVRVLQLEEGEQK